VKRGKQNDAAFSSVTPAELEDFFTEGPFRPPTHEEIRALVQRLPPDIIDYAASGGGPLMTRLFSCIFYKRPIPDNLRKEFVLACVAVMNEEKTWDDVFGNSRKKGKHRGAALRKQKIAIRLCIRVETRRKRGERVDKQLFNSVGKEFGVSGTVASEIYYKERAARSEMRDHERFREDIENFGKLQKDPPK
jgi:hypothetical protein